MNRVTMLGNTMIHLKKTSLMAGAALATLLSHYPVLAIFEYDRAIKQSQKENWSGSLEHLKAALTEQPDRADILYDAGISSYKNQEFDKALIYFNNAAHSKKASQQLQEQAHFNAGNTQVQLKQLQPAIDAYDAVLSLNPTHEKAQHNKEIVKKMLEQEKQDKNNKDQEDKEQQKDDDQNQKNNDQNQQDQHKNQDQKEQSLDNNNADKQKNTRNEQQNSSDQQRNNDHEKKQQKQNGNEQGDKKSQEQQRHDNKDSGHDTKEQASSSQNANPSSMEKDSGNQQQLSGALEYVLKEHEKKDAQLNKKMIKEMAQTKAGGTHGTHSW